MDSVNKTLYIPLYGKSLVSKKNIILKDIKAEEVWDMQTIELNKKSKSKWLAYYMAMRAKVFDEWVKDRLLKNPNAIVLHLGCGLDGRIERINADAKWYDVDFEGVINERKKYYAENKNYKMLSSDITDVEFLDKIENFDSAIVIMEGVSMYIENQKLLTLIKSLKNKFAKLSILVDCYTPFAVKMSKIKNPVKEVGVRKVFGIENSTYLEKAGVNFVTEREITPLSLINELKGFERFFFKRVYGGKISKKLYKLYEYKESSYVAR